MATVYATVEQLKAQPGISSSEDDTVIELLLTAASLAIDGYCNRLEDGFKATTVTSARLFYGTGKHYIWTDEMVAFTSVEVKWDEDDAWTVQTLGNFSGFTGSPEQPNFNRTPYRGIMITAGSILDFPNAERQQVWVTSSTPQDKRIYPNVRVTGRWGYDDIVPETVVSATIILASRWFKRGQSFWADTIGSDTFGELQYRKMVDPDVQMMLEMGRLRRPIYG